MNYITKKPESGFTLIESLIAMLVFVVGSLAMAGLLLQGIRMQSFSRDANRANALANAQIEQLRRIPRTDPQRAAGGDLNSNTASHFDNPTGTAFTRRWTIAAGPSGTQDITVVVVSNGPSVRIPPIRIHALLP